MASGTVACAHGAGGVGERGERVGVGGGFALAPAAWYICGPHSCVSHALSRQKMFVRLRSFRK